MGKRGDPICKGKNPIRLFNVENVIFSVCWLATQIPFLNTHLTNFSSLSKLFEKAISLPKLPKRLYFTT